jgi:hypothetical protein
MYTHTFRIDDAFVGDKAILFGSMFCADSPEDHHNLVVASKSQMVLAQFRFPPDVSERFECPSPFDLDWTSRMYVYIKTRGDGFSGGTSATPTGKTQGDSVVPRYMATDPTLRDVIFDADFQAGIPFVEPTGMATQGAAQVPALDTQVAMNDTPKKKHASATAVAPKKKRASATAATSKKKKHASAASKKRATAAAVATVPKNQATVDLTMARKATLAAFSRDRKLVQGGKLHPLDIGCNIEDNESDKTNDHMDMESPESVNMTVKNDDVDMESPESVNMTVKNDDVDMESVKMDIQSKSDEEEEEYGLMGEFVGQKIRLKIDRDYHDGKVLGFSEESGLYTVEWYLDDEPVVETGESGWSPSMVEKNLI